MSEKKDKKEVKDSNELLNIFLIIIGGLFIFQGIIYYVEAYFPGTFGFMPTWILDNLGGGSGGDGTQAFQALMGDSALMRLVMGAWAFIAGIGMFGEQEWAWGQALVVMSMILVTTGGAVITNFTNGAVLTAALWTSWPWYIQFISVVFSALGI
ncbi:MAG: hypothetical protein GYA24_24550, partial [Candidatus Lokiarchaeota archaeon]|nr:hypothetical protein [Candidatus Lokiarchaeota archaeon]